MFRYLNPFTKKIGYYGWTGRSNLGDEALYEIIRTLLKPADLLQVRRFTKKGKFIESFQKKHISGMMMGAGTLINSSGQLSFMKEFINEKIPCFSFGAGVLDPDFYSELHNYPNDMYEWVELLRKFKAVSVRGPLSAKVLENYGYGPVNVIGDPVLSFAPDTMPIRKKGNVIGMNFGTTGNNSRLWGGSDDKVTNFLVIFLDALIQKGYRIKLFPVWKNDISTVLSVAKRVDGDVEVCRHTINMNSYLKTMDPIDIFIGEKLHSVIGALCNYVPSIMLSYQPKCDDFMASVDLQEYTMRTDDLNVEKLMFLIEKINNTYDEYRNKIFNEIHKYKIIQNEFAKNIIDNLI